MNAKNQMLTLSTVLGLMVCVWQPAMADWDPGDPHKMHYPQLPDMNTTGLDVLATSPKVLADDWQCSETGPVSDIHIWGSWLDDQLPTDATGVGDPGLVGFRLSIHADIPAAQNPDGFSKPGSLLWEQTFNPGDFAVRFWGTAQEGFYDPNQGAIIGADTQVWQYNFLIPDTDAFVQKQGTIYWLDLEAFPVGPPPPAQPLFGWKTSRDNFNDDAVYGDQPNLNWQELIYPSGHPLQGQSIDLAFVITPEPASLVLLGAGGLVFLRRRRTQLPH